MERNDAKRVGSLLHQFLKSTKLETGYGEYKLKKSWNSLLGVTVARKTKSLQIKDRKLYVTLHSSVVRNELEMMKDALLPRLNEAAGMKVIDEIILR